MKNWLITGASSGIGRGIALTALKNGDHVIVTSRNLSKLQDVVKEYPKTCFPAQLELSSSQSISDFIELVKNKFSKIDVLVNNAGYGYLATVEEGTDSEIKKLFDVNLFGPVKLIQAFLPQMREIKSGTIVNISSVNAIEADAGSSFYAAAKVTLTRLSEGLQQEVAPFNIKVMAVEPGGFNTHFYGENLKEVKDKVAEYDQAEELDRKSNIPPDFKAPGDPIKAGEIIYQEVNDPDSPLNLLLGSDAVEIAETQLTSRLNQVKRWSKISQQTDYK